jgi:ribonuclease R/exosome complex exonuclease DIS3/RRP44
MEILATKAERSSIKYMQVKFMLDHQNKIYEGVISGVTERGLYVEIITNKCEGMVRIKDIPGDYYIYNPQEYALVGEKTNVIYRLGDEVKIKVKKADLIKKHLDFLLVP